MMSPAPSFVVITLIIAINLVAAQPEPSYHKFAPSGEDRCNYADPQFPYALDKVTYKQIY